MVHSTLHASPIQGRDNYWSCGTEFRSSSVPVTHEGYLVESRRALWFSPHKPIALSLIH